MVKVKREGDLYEITLSVSSRAPREAVYDLLADLRSHLEWGGTRQPTRSQRLISIEAPDGPATEGVEFRSVGATSRGNWHDHSRVTVAERPAVFEFVTEGKLECEADCPPVEGTWVHRYELTPEDGGCVVLYRCKQCLVNPPDYAHTLYPAIIYNLVLPTVQEQGLRSLIQMAEERSGTGLP